MPTQTDIHGSDWGNSRTQLVSWLKKILCGEGGGGAHKILLMSIGEPGVEEEDRV